MNSLSINTIINTEQDSELTSYKILGTFKEYLENIRKYKIYPALSELVGLAVKLENLKNTVTKPDYSDKDLFILNEDIPAFEEFQKDTDYSDVEDSVAYIDWIISQLNPVLDEGIAVYDFVDQNMKIQLIHGDPLFKDEGYLAVRDNITSVINIYRYNCKLSRFNNIPEKMDKTDFVMSINANDKQENEDLIIYLDNTSLPVYLCETELDFPYEETIFQIARKKLLSTLSA
jgi:hypothetical protein